MRVSSIIASSGSVRMWDQGNATEYATWVDECLNIVLRSVARRMHPLKFDLRLLQAFLLCALLGLNPCLGQSQEDEEEEEAGQGP